MTDKILICMMICLALRLVKDDDSPVGTFIAFTIGFIMAFTGIFLLFSGV